MSRNGPDRVAVIGPAARCAVRVVSLLARRRLHVVRPPAVRETALPDGRSFVVFRQTTRDLDLNESPVTLAVWFRLRVIPPGARVRRWLFERVCIVNTLLFAGFDGYLVKLWMVDPSTSDYAGLYSWRSTGEADTYGRYITALLRPFCTPGSVGYGVFAQWTLDAYLSSRSR